MTLDDGGDGVEDDEPHHVDNELMKLPEAVRRIYETLFQDLWKYFLGILNCSILYLIRSISMVIVELLPKQAVCL